MPTTQRRTKPRVTITNPERLTYPRDGLTKQQVADYWRAVEKPFLRAVKDRPLQFRHWPKNIDSEPWFQQNVGDEAEPWMRLVEVVKRSSSRTVRHLVADRPETLQWLAQHNALEIHCFNSRAQAIEEPDWVVFDLDPAEGRGIEQAIPIALLLRDVLERVGLPSVVKTSGQRGLHVYVPLEPGHTHEQAIAFAAEVGTTLTAHVKEATMERALAARRGRLYFDCFQNGRGKTVIAPYSLRAVDGAPVATPLDWSEVTPALDPRAFNLRTVPARLAEAGDPFAAVFRRRARLP